MSLMATASLRSIETLPASSIAKIARAIAEGKRRIWRRINASSASRFEFLHAAFIPSATWAGSSLPL